MSCVNSSSNGANVPPTRSVARHFFTISCRNREATSSSTNLTLLSSSSLPETFSTNTRPSASSANASAANAEGLTPLHAAVAKHLELRAAQLRTDATRAAAHAAALADTAPTVVTACKLKHHARTSTRTHGHPRLLTQATIATAVPSKRLSRRAVLRLPHAR